MYSEASPRHCKLPTVADDGHCEEVSCTIKKLCIDYTTYARAMKNTTTCEWGWKQEGRTRLSLALVIWPLATRPFRDGAPILLLTETPPT